MQGAAERIAREGLADLGTTGPWLASAKLKLVDACNLRCFMCDYWKRRRAGELTETEVMAVLDDLAALSCRKVHLTGGELFMRQDIERIVARASEHGMRVNLTTNGTLLSKERVKELLRHRVRSITLSLDAPAPSVHDAIRGRDGAWKKTVKTLDRLLARRGPKTRIRVNTVVSRRNLRTFAGWPGFFADRPVDGWLLIPLDESGENTGHLTAADVHDYTSRIAPLLAESIRVPGFDPWIYGRSTTDLAYSAERAFARGHYEEHLCYVPWFHTLVGPSGDVYACCNLHRRTAPLGNVREQPLQAIFQGPRYVAFREEMARSRMAHCHGCADFLHENRSVRDALRENAR